MRISWTPCTRALGRGKVRLYPAMPYASYTYMSDADALAIKAYLFSLKPVHAPAPVNTLKLSLQPAQPHESVVRVLQPQPTL